MAKIKTADEGQSDAIAEAMAAASAASGAASLPSEVPEALAFGVVAANKSPYHLGNAVLESATQTAELMANPNCPPDVRLIAQQMATALAAQAPAPPPVQVGIGQSTVMVPASVRLNAHNLHKTNPRQAKLLWDGFVGDQKKQMAILAAKSGFLRDPFVWLAQALVNLIQIQSWQPTKAAGDREFDPSERDTAGPQYQGLIAWAGQDLARAIVNICEAKNVSVLSGLRQMYIELERQKQEELSRAQSMGTVEQWAE